MDHVDDDQLDTPPDILELIDGLEDLVSMGRRIPFSGRVTVDEGEFLNLIEDLRVTVPAEIRQAQRVVKERERIIGASQAEATKIVETAKQRAEYYASREGILNEARQRSEEVLRNAEKERRRALGEVEMYAIDQLKLVEDAIQEGFKVIKDAMKDSLETLDGALARAQGQSEEWEDET